MVAFACRFSRREASSAIFRKATEVESFRELLRTHDRAEERNLRLVLYGAFNIRNDLELVARFLWQDERGIISRTSHG